MNTEFVQPLMNIAPSVIYTVVAVILCLIYNFISDRFELFHCNFLFFLYLMHILGMVYVMCNIQIFICSVSLLVIVTVIYIRYNKR